MESLSEFYLCLIYCIRICDLFTFGLSLRASPIVTAFSRQYFYYSDILCKREFLFLCKSLKSALCEGFVLADGVRKGPFRSNHTRRSTAQDTIC